MIENLAVSTLAQEINNEIFDSSPSGISSVEDATGFSGFDGGDFGGGGAGGDF